MKATALQSTHVGMGARMVPFAGWTMPVQYAGVLEEARAVRTRAGLFDLGHMGRVRLRGEGAEALLQRVQTNDAAKIAPGQIRYSMLLASDAGVLDDILVYREPAGGGFFLVVNASNTEQDLAHLRAEGERIGKASITDQTEDLGMIAIQGPEAAAITQSLCKSDLASLKYYWWTSAEVAGIRLELSRTGYTGEDGFEFYVPQEETVRLWRALLEHGRSRGLVPVGLGARDTLRLEAGMPLYGHEIDKSVNPLEAGLGFAVKFTHDFIGRRALEAYRDGTGPFRSLVGLTTKSKRIPRQGYKVFDGDVEVGEVCSGAASPTLELNIATCYVPAELAAPGTPLTFDVRGAREPATVTALPFYRRRSEPRQKP
jgi:aminomethyltransferase